MSAAASAPRGLNGAAIARATIATLVFLSGFVMIEPAPSDLLLCLVVLVWLFFGLKLTRAMTPLIALMMLYVAGGLLSFTQLTAFAKPTTYLATTAFLVISAIFYCAILQADTARRLRTIERAYIASAIVCALIGILGYFGAIPGASMFTLYERAKGPFKDPNVFGPFLILPFVVLARSILTRSILRSGWSMLGALILLAGIFLSFSRGAWGMAILSLAVMVLLVFITEHRSSKRLRMLAALSAGVLFVALILVVAVSIPAVQEVFVQRFKLLQDYDASRLGRFERHLIGLFLIQEHPLGIGPFQFGLTMGEDEHNMWLKGFTVYGWLGGFAYIALAILTLVIATPLVFLKRAWTPFIQCVYAVFIGQLFIHNVIDNDHWRHLFLIYGLLWGAYSVERSAAKTRAKIDRPRTAPEAMHIYATAPVALPRAATH
ncbi:O-antigen ligase [Kaistia hirudinis]|uniref:O-antigen ligase n=1 Tax=Kaistia hirudinis TaxID=1293440 RepID=A0A840AK88_9HYPH|nr:O-antigen ligase family protein [Kaistia hirudinis]MBB3929351.1 O-antigen ligase [Kaistia hirudinis]